MQGIQRKGDYAMQFAVNIKNVDKDCKRYVVARESDGILWFWGSWDDKEEAQKVANEVKGILCERI